VISDTVAGASGEASLETCGTIPRVVDADLTVGPGCVDVEEYVTISSGTLTIAPGTTVRMAPGTGISFDGGYTSAIVAIGTEDAPIVFTSASDNPMPGDWARLRIPTAASNSELRNVTLEYGGATPEGSEPSDLDALVIVNAGMRAVSNCTFRHSASRGVTLEKSGTVREFANNTFESNAKRSLFVHPNQLLNLGQGHQFLDADDAIDVQSGEALSFSGTWSGQPVPFVLDGGLDINNHAVVTLGPGATVALTGGSIEVFNSSLDIAGTEEQPVSFTSANPNPMPGDWGCLYYYLADSAGRIEHAVFEYAGSGDGCTGGEYETALLVDAGSQISGSTFRNGLGVGIQTSGECGADWCDNTFSDLERGPMMCTLDDVVVGCD
jgi:hypothetical protein